MLSHVDIFELCVLCVYAVFIRAEFKKEFDCIRRKIKCDYFCVLFLLFVCIYLIVSNECPNLMIGLNHSPSIT